MSGPTLLDRALSLVPVTALLTLVWILLPGQETKVDPSQVKPAVAVVEWATCTRPPIEQPGLTVDCAGIELYRFRLPDGSVRGPYLAVPAPAGFVADPKVWTWKPLQ